MNSTTNVRAKPVKMSRKAKTSLLNGLAFVNPARKCS
jgi:hypothetical protein